MISHGKESLGDDPGTDGHLAEVITDNSLVL